MRLTYSVHQCHCNRHNNNNNNDRISIAPYGRNFRGTVGRSDQPPVPLKLRLMALQKVAIETVYSKYVTTVCVLHQTLMTPFICSVLWYCWITDRRGISLRFNDHFAGGPGLAGTGMSLFWILLELRMMEVVHADNWSCKTCKAPVKS